MGKSKTDLFTDEQNAIAQMAKALAHPARIAILQYLLKTKACVNGELVDELGLAQATISQHLQELKAIGLIQGSVEGPRINYCINSQRWMEVQQLFNLLFQQLQHPLPDYCC